MAGKLRIYFRPEGAYDNFQLPKGVSCLPLWGRGTVAGSIKQEKNLVYPPQTVDEVPIDKSRRSLREIAPAFSFPPKATAFGNEVSLEIVKNLSFQIRHFLTVFSTIYYNRNFL